MQKGCWLGSKECCINLSIMFKAVAKDLIDQEVQRRERMKFQEGVETAGTAEIKV
jgi:hypothetical protein